MSLSDSQQANNKTNQRRNTLVKRKVTKKILTATLMMARREPTKANNKTTKRKLQINQEVIENDYRNSSNFQGF